MTSSQNPKPLHQTQPENQTPQPEEVEAEAVSEVTKALAPLMREPAKAPIEAARILAISESYSGPTPHPRHLAEIERLVPGGAKQLVDSARLEQQHRHRMQTLEMLYPYAGLFLGAFLMLLCIAAAVFLAVRNDTTVALALIGVPVLTAIGWMIKARVFAPRPQPSRSPPPKNPRRKK